jgi:hypothetical protein
MIRRLASDSVDTTGGRRRRRRARTYDEGRCPRLSALVSKGYFVRIGGAMDGIRMEAAEGDTEFGVPQ